MKKWLWKTYRLLLCVAVLCSMFLINCNIVNASEMTDLPYIVIDGYELTQKKVIPGAEFTLTIKLHNSSKEVAAENVVVNITNPNGVLPVYGKVSQVLIDSIAPGEEKTINFDYTSMAELTGDYLDFYVSASGITYTNVVLRVPMGVDSPFSIIAYSIPNEMYTSEIGSAYVSFKVLGDENVRNVYLELLLDSQVISKSSVGTLTPGVTRTQSLSPMMSTPGVYEAKLILHYDDAAEQTQSIIVNTETVTVKEKKDNSSTELEIIADPKDEKREINQGIIMGTCGIIILVVMSLFVIIIRKNK